MSEEVEKVEKVEVKEDEPLYYVKNKDLIPEIEKMSENDGQLSEELGRMVLLIAKNLSNKGNFINYTWKEDMIQEGVLTCCKYLRNFDLNKSKNPFAYITTICTHAFVNYINRQKKHSDIKDRCFHNREFVVEDDTLTLSNKAIDYSVMSRETKKKKKKKAES